VSDDGEPFFPVNLGDGAFAQIGLGQVRPRQIRTAQNGATQICAMQNRAGQVRAAQVSCEQNRAGQIGSRQRYAFHNRTGEVGVGQIAAGKVQAFEHLVREVRACAAHFAVHEEIMLAANFVGFSLADRLVLYRLADHETSPCARGSQPRSGRTFSPVWLRPR
jgi:hypothetical protein